MDKLELKQIIGLIMLIYIYFIKMKIIIKEQSQVKLYSGQLILEELLMFVKASFDKIAVPQLYYVDQDGDKITIANQEDLQTIKDLFADSPYIKLILSQGQTKAIESTTSHTLQKQQPKSETQEIKPNEKNPQKQTHCRQESRHYSKKNETQEKRNSSEKRHHWKDRKHGRGCKQQNGRFDERHEHQRENIDSIERKIQQKIVEIVDERIKAVLPCMKNQMSQDFQVIKQVGRLVHQGTKCTGCGAKQIVGIRYNCIICPSFDLCQRCEEKIQHQHNLLKMRKPEKLLTEQKRKQKGLLCIGRKLIKELINPCNDSSSKSKSKSPKRHHWKKHCYRQRRYESNGAKIQRRMQKLCKVFGQRANLREFIQKTLQFRCYQIISIYAQENGIDKNQFACKRNQWKKVKLAAFYSKPEAEFQEIVKKNPNCNFRQIIKILKEEGYGDYNGDNFKRMRQTLRRCPRREELKGESQSEKKQPKEQIKGNGQEYRQKGKILMEMKDLFGENRAKSMYKFIQENFKEGKQSIIQKWISKLEKKN